MPAELPFKGGDGEVLNMQEVEFLPGTDPQPGGLHGNVVRPVDRLPPHGRFKESGGRLNVARRDREVQNGHEEKIRNGRA
ncbi:MAG: hypothetical protein NT069_16185, partial [Planctomycetota bacterium]|nr:hypothetical protein [Planctomycetota bacterium]